MFPGAPCLSENARLLAAVHISEPAAASAASERERERERERSTALDDRAAAPRKKKKVITDTVCVTMSAPGMGVSYETWRKNCYSGRTMIASFVSVCSRVHVYIVTAMCVERSYGWAISKG